MSTQPYVVIVGHDFSELAEEAARTGVAIARGTPNGELHFVHAIPPPAVGSELGPAFPSDTMLAQAKKDLVSVVQGLQIPKEVSIQLHVVVGNPDQVLAEMADEYEADLIVLGTHGRKGLQRLILGSVAEQTLRRASCSVLTVRKHKPTARESIQPPCPECVKAKKETNNPKALCANHTHKHGRAHTYSENPPSFGMGSMSFRFPD